MSNTPGGVSCLLDSEDLRFRKLIVSGRQTQFPIVSILIMAMLSFFLVQKLKKMEGMSEIPEKHQYKMFLYTFFLK